MLLPVHIVAGGLAIVLGAVALLASKGQWLHRRSGLLFVCAMLAMGVSGAVLALRQSLTNVNALGGAMSVYFVLTAFTTVQPVSARRAQIDRAALILGAVAALAWYAVGIRAVLNGRYTFMAYATFVFGTAMALALVGDVRVMRMGWLPRASRLARHLWRMCFALFIAAASFFSIQERVAKVLPAPFTTPLMRALPVVLIFVAMFFWLWRVRVKAPAARQQQAPVAV